VRRPCVAGHVAQPTSQDVDLGFGHRCGHGLVSGLAVGGCYPPSWSGRTSWQQRPSATRAPSASPPGLSGKVAWPPPRCSPAGRAIPRDWLGLATAALATLAAGLILWFCWRFVGAGLGDVRLAVLGGLGLGHVTHTGLVIGVATFTLITLTKAAVTLARGGTRHGSFPFGPALATGFLLAAAL
jgi:hypothetical protein